MTAISPLGTPFSSEHFPIEESHLIKQTVLGKYHSESVLASRSDDLTHEGTQVSATASHTVEAGEGSDDGQKQPRLGPAALPTNDAAF